jgi:L-ascorbate metabolism protein UlaG (beta-lactamase superfamily)
MKLVTVLFVLLHAVGFSTVHAALSNKGDRIEYIGHASFRFVAEDGSAVVIDPFNSRIWMGYNYPKGIKADAVLITHPHFDHDASYYFEGSAVYTEPGTHQVGSIKVRGVATEHGFAEVIRQRGFLPVNTVWIIEFGGKRILHLGDSRKVSDEELAQIGQVDIVIGDEEQASAVSLNAAHTIPNHYRLPQVSPTGGQGMSTVDELVKGKSPVLRLGDNVLMLNELRDQDKWIVLKPMAELEGWSEAQMEAKREVQLARQSMRGDEPNYNLAEEHLTKSLALDPGDISTYSVLSDLYKAQGKSLKDITDALELGLAKATDRDTGQEYKLRSKLGNLYEESKQQALAKKQYVWIVSKSKAYGVKEHEQASTFLDNTNAG